MDECLQSLDEGKEYPNDEILIQQVRLQLIVEKGNRGVSYDGALESTEHTESTSPYIEGLRSRLEAMKISILAKSQSGNNGKLPCFVPGVKAYHMMVEVVLLHLHSAELETALPPTFLHSNGSTVPQPHSLNAGLEAIKSWFSIFFTIAPATYIGFPFSVFSQLMRCIVTLYRIRALDDPTWNKGDLWEVLLILDRVIDKMKQVPVVAALDNGKEPEGDTFSRTAQLLQTLRSAWTTQLRSDALSISAISPPQNVDESALADSLGMDFLDSDWLSEFLLPSN